MTVFDSRGKKAARYRVDTEGGTPVTATAKVPVVNAGRELDFVKPNMG